MDMLTTLIAILAVVAFLDHWVRYVIDVIRRRGRVTERETFPKDLIGRHPQVAFDGERLTIGPSARPDGIRVSSIRGIWAAQAGLWDFIDPMFIGLVLYDDKGRATQIKGWVTRTDAPEGRKAQRSDRLLADIIAAAGNAPPARVRGYLTYRMFAIMSTIFLVHAVLVDGQMFVAQAVTRYPSLLSWSRTMSIALLASPVLWVLLLKGLWRAGVRIQIRFAGKWE
jgi:hypothetical protein